MKSQRFNLSKVLMMFVFTILAGLVLVACGNSDQKLVDEALDTIAVTFAKGDSQSSVTKNLVLPESIGEIAITWVSGSPDVISNAGVVTRPATDKEVTLTATLKLGKVQETHSVKVTVKAAEVVVDPLDALDAIVITGSTYEKVGAVYQTTTDIVLPATALGLAVTWTTSNANYIALDGKVVRPAFGVADQVISLTATIQGEDKVFLVKVLTYAVKPVSQILEEAQTALLIDGIANGFAIDLELATTVGSEGVTVTWSSSNTAILANDGKVTRPAMGLDDVEITLIATLTKDTQSVTKEFKVLILANVEPTLYASVAAVLAGAEKGDFVKVEDVTVFGLTADSYIFGDATGNLAVYLGSSPVGKVEVGKVYDIYGLFDVYNGSAQLNSLTDATMPAVATLSDGAVTVLTPTIVNDVTVYVPDTAPTYGPSNLFVYEYIEITAKVRVQGDGNYDTFFVNTDYSGGNINSDANSPYTDNAIMIYYKSNLGAFKAFDGKVVTFKAFMYSYRNDRTVNTLIFMGEAEDITFVASDTEAVQMAKDEFASLFKFEYIKAATLSLPITTSQNATIVWSTVSTLVNTTTGALVMPATGQEEVVLTAAITKGTQSGTFTVTFKAGVLPNITILQAVEIGKAHLVEVTGIVTAAEYQNTYFIQDETAGIAIYSGDAEVEAFLKANYGKEVTLIGETDVYNGLVQIKNISSKVLVGTPATPIVAVNVDAHQLDATLLAPFQGQLVEFKDLIVVGVAKDTYNNVVVTLLDMVSGNKVDMKYDSRVTLATAPKAVLDGLVVGDVVTIVNPLAWSKGPFLYFTDTTVVTKGVLTDAAAVAATKVVLKINETQPIVANATLALLAANLGTTITWASSNAAVITNAGVVTIPADMKQVKVVMTATITKGIVTDTKAFDVLVGDIISIDASYAVATLGVVRVQGVVVAGEYYNTFFIQDSTGGIAVYTFDATHIATFKANVGKEVIVTGTRDTYNGLRQIRSTAVVALTSGNLPAATNVDAVKIDKVDMLVHQGKLVELTNLLVTKVEVDSYENISITLLRPLEGTTIVLRFDSRATLSSAAQTAIEAVKVGDVLNVVAAMAWYNGPQLYYTNTTVLTAGSLTDAQKVAGDAFSIMVPKKAEDATPIVLPLTGTLGSTIAWTSNDDAVLNAATGVVVLPAEGSVIITLTATVTLNLAEKVATFKVVVGVPEVTATSGASDLFISEYIEGGSNNKALEIFNGTGAVVDLSTYSLRLYSNGSSDPLTYVLTGTLAAGEVYVVANSQSVAPILAVADKTFSYVNGEFGANWNGDDAVALVKSDVVIDIIGEVGVRIKWPVGTSTTENSTLVRVKTIVGPNAVFTASEWMAYPQDTFDYIGSHLMKPVGSVTVAVTASYTNDALTTNMVVGANSADLLNLDPLIFDVQGSKGAQTNNVGLNKAGQMRLYSDATTGNGNLLSFTIASGYKITRITINYGASTKTPTATLTLGSTVVELVESDLVSKITSYDSLSIQAFSFENNTLTTGGQVWITSIVIEYQPNVG